MKAPLASLTLAAVALASPASASAPGGPFGPVPTQPFPLGCPVPFTVVNDTANTIQISPCLPPVTDEGGQLVFGGFCLQSLIFLEPGGAFTMYWTQINEAGDQVPPGVYFFGGQKFDIGAADAAVAALGSPKTGAQRSFQLCAPGSANLAYLLAASGSSAGGIPLCGGALSFPLDFDGIFQASQSLPAFFIDFSGTLDAAGRTTAPALAVPANPALVGLGLELAFLTLDPSDPCGIGDISPPLAVTIQ